MPDNAVGAGQTMQHFINIDDLFNCIRRSGLLTVAESGIGDKNFLRHIDWNMSMVICNLRNHIIGKNFPEQLRRWNILQSIYILILFEKMCVLVVQYLFHHFSPVHPHFVKD